MAFRRKSESWQEGVGEGGYEGVVELAERPHRVNGRLSDWLCGAGLKTVIRSLSFLPVGFCRSRVIPCHVIDCRSVHRQFPILGRLLFQDLPGLMSMGFSNVRA